MSPADVEYNDFLTDDELVAIAVDSGGRWPIPLPTVDVTDAPSLQRSGIRGLRSLLLRGALADEGGLDPRVGRIAEAARAATALVAYVGDREGTPLGGEFSRAVVPTDSGFLLDEMSGIGLHRFSWLEDAAAVLGYFSAMVAVVSDRGLPTSYGVDARLCLSVVTEVGANVLAVGQGSTSKVALDPAGAVVSVSPETGEIPRAVARLVGLLDVAD